MVQFVYIDETGSSGRGARRQALMTLVAVLVDEDKVMPLGSAMRRVADEHLDMPELRFEWHGQEVWHGSGPWAGKEPAERLAAYEAVLGLLDELELELSYASIDKPRLNARYGEGADRNAYRLALQFLLEKVDLLGGKLRVVVADEVKEQQLPAVHMVADMQQWGWGEVSSRPLRRVIDSLHFVSSATSPGVQMADLVAFAMQRHWSRRDSHPDAVAGLERMWQVIDRRRVTWRESWPAPRR